MAITGGTSFQEEPGWLFCYTGSMNTWFIRRFLSPFRAPYLRIIRIKSNSGDKRLTHCSFCFGHMPEPPIVQKHFGNCVIFKKRLLTVQLDKVLSTTSCIFAPSTSLPKKGNQLDLGICVRSAHFILNLPQRSDSTNLAHGGQWPSSLRQNDFSQCFFICVSWAVDELLSALTH